MALMPRWAEVACGSCNTSAHPHDPIKGHYQLHSLSLSLSTEDPTGDETIPQQCDSGNFEIGKRLARFLSTQLCSMERSWRLREYLRHTSTQPQPPSHPIAPIVSRVSSQQSTRLNRRPGNAVASPPANGLSSRAMPSQRLIASITCR